MPSIAKTYLNYSMFWLVLVAIAVGNGAIKQMLILPRTNELTTHQFLYCNA